MAIVQFNMILINKEHAKQNCKTTTLEASHCTNYWYRLQLLTNTKFKLLNYQNKNVYKRV